MIQTKSEAT